MNTARRKITLLGTTMEVDALEAALRALPGCDVQRGAAALPGATVVVLDGDARPGLLAQRAPDAKVVVLGDGAAVGAVVGSTRFPRARVLGVTNVAASVVASEALAAAAAVAARDARVMVLGGSGRAAVAALSLATVGGMPAGLVLGGDVLASAVRDALREPPGPFAVAAAAAEVVAAVLGDERRVLPCAVACHGEYGIGGAAVAVPVVVGCGGVEAVLEVPLTADERAALGRAAAL